MQKNYGEGWRGKRYKKEGKKVKEEIEDDGKY
jgi:hypothetical protein